MARHDWLTGLIGICDFLFCFTLSERAGITVLDAPCSNKAKSQHYLITRLIQNIYIFIIWQGDLKLDQSIFILFLFFPFLFCFVLCHLIYYWY